MTEKQEEARLAGTTLSKAEQTLRERHWQVVQKHAAPGYIEALRRFADLQFGAWADYFPGLVPPVPRLSTPSNPRAEGTYAPVAGDGLRGEIRLRPALLNGKHPIMRPGPEFAEGRFLYVADVLLHESAHAFCEEVLGDSQNAYHGHGPAFRDVCNAIGARLGLPPVRTSKRRGADADLPSCAQWPMCVRPPGYYLGALRDGRDDTAEGDTTPPADDLRATLLEALVVMGRAMSKASACLAEMPLADIAEAMQATGIGDAPFGDEHQAWGRKLEADGREVAMMVVIPASGDAATRNYEAAA